MSIQRPTFHESWYRIRGLCVSLRPGVQIQRQHYRGRRWRLVQDPASQDYFRISEPAYRFIGLLDGSRTVEEAWSICGQQLGDDAPTQGEAIRLLGQLWSSNLIVGDVSPDVQAMLRRQRTRGQRELKGRLSSLLSLRIPVFDPDLLLSGVARSLAWLFTPFGFALWALVILAGLWQLAGRTDALVEAAGHALDPANLPWLYGSFVVVKLLHELGHGLSCKVFGSRERTGGEVHAIGVMFLVLLPMPYVDATSAWGLRSKWQRIIVGSAGMMVELVCASIAAWVWTHTTPGSATSIVAANTILIAGVSTLLFNGNPLLRFDGYYILSDLIEMPNLQQRSRDYLYSLVKRRVWGVSPAQATVPSPPSSSSERTTLIVFGILSTSYRLLITFTIILFVAGKLFFIGVALALMALLAWFIFPIIKFAHYLATSPELARVRPRALSTSIGLLAIVLFALGVIPAPSRVRAQGVVESPTARVVRMNESGFISSVLESGAHVEPSDVIVESANMVLEYEVTRWSAQHARFVAQRRKARTEDVAKASIAQTQVRVAKGQLEAARKRVARLAITADNAGLWSFDQSRVVVGTFLRQGEPLGLVIDPDQISIRVELNQDTAAMLIGRAGQAVSIRPAQGDAATSVGIIERVVEAGRPERNEAEEATRNGPGVFEMMITPDANAGRLLPGRQMVVRVNLDREPIGLQVLRSLRRVLQGRFGG